MDWRRTAGGGSGLSIERVLSYGSCPWKAEFDSAYRVNVFGPTGHAHGQLSVIVLFIECVLPYGSCLWKDAFGVRVPPMD